MPPPLLAIDGLDVAFRSERGSLPVLRDVSLSLDRGQVMGVVGESGSGKSTLALAILRLLPANLERLSGSVRLGGEELLRLPEPVMQRLRGSRIAMVFQDPMTALNPVFTVGTQLEDLQRSRLAHAASGTLHERAARMMQRVGIADPGGRLRQYPHEFSGGMRQRIMIAAALLAEPELLIADEPTTALDPTIEAQIVALMGELRDELSGSMLLISHSLGLIAELAHAITVLYGGIVVESGPAGDVLRRPLHPYTQALVACEPDGLAPRGTRLASIPGEVPDLARLPQGCIFAERCPLRIDRCRDAQPPLRPMGGDRRVACIRA